MTPEIWGKNWKRDWVGEWFPILEARGECVEIAYGEISGAASSPVWVPLRHQNFDGIGGLAHLMSQKGEAIESLDTLRDSRVPSLWARFRAFIHFLRTSSLKGVKWKIYDSEKTGKNSEIAWTVWDESETKAIALRAKERGVSLNSYLLLAVDQALSPIWTDVDSPRRWLIPVNMRGPVVREVATSNHSSYVSVSIPRDLSPLALHDRIHGEIRKNSHWGAWMGITIGRFIGIGGMKKILQSMENQDHCWMGTFSNLGSRGSPTASAASARLFCPPPTRSHPIALGCLTWNGKLTICLRIHPVLSQKAEDAWNSLRACRDRIMSS